MKIIDVIAVRSAFEMMARAIRLNRDELTRLDSQIGDGDVGITLEEGFTTLVEEARRFQGDDVSLMFTKLGVAMNRAASSTLGTLLAFGILRAGRAMAGKTHLTVHDVALILQAMAEAIQERGRAKPGDKTILDALVPAQLAFTSAVTAGEELEAAWGIARAAAEDGLAQTVAMPSRVGRAAVFGEKTKGVADPGAYVCVILFRAVDECLRDSRTAQHGGD